MTDKPKNIADMLMDVVHTLDTKGISDPEVVGLAYRDVRRAANKLRDILTKHEVRAARARVVARVNERMEESMEDEA